jgi:hypothetical protein
MMGLYSSLVNNFGWSLRDIDNTYLDTLIDFIYYKDNDPNTKVINGKTYHRAKGVPSWL